MPRKRREKSISPLSLKIVTIHHSLSRILKKIPPLWLKFKKKMAIKNKLMVRTVICKSYRRVNSCLLSSKKRHHSKLPSLKLLRKVLHPAIKKSPRILQP